MLISSIAASVAPALAVAVPEAGVTPLSEDDGGTLTGGGLDPLERKLARASAVLVGRTNSDLVLNSISMAIMMLTGLAVGWRVNSSPLEFLAGIALLLLFSYAFSWVMALLGIVGGLETFGLLGLFIGPTLMAVVLTVWRQVASADPDPADTPAPPPAR